jgi:4-amino-4-deoxy-L-arabinose transferase-like glycosyltransferase
LLFIYGFLVSLYSFQTPLLEAPDAYYHFAVIEYIARNGNLPPKDNPQEHLWKQAVFHAPLYHILAAQLIRRVDTSDFPSAYPRNPHARIGLPEAQDNRNFVAHIGDPLQKTGLAVRLVSMFSIALGALTLVGIYALARGAAPRRPSVALLAVLIVMLNPQFLFISGSVNNDNLVTALSSLSLALLVYMIRRGMTAASLVVLAVLLACNALAKASGLALYPIAVLCLSWIWWRDKLPFYRLVQAGLMLLSAWLLIAGWWYISNLLTYGDPTTSTLLAHATGLRVGTLHDIDIIGELRGLYYSFWGLFGWFNIGAPAIFYGWTLLLVVSGVIGFILRALRARHTRDDLAIALILLFFSAAIIGSWWQFNLLVPAGQGRLWFPLLGVLACILALGLAHLRRTCLVLISGMGLAAVGLPFLLIYPAYQPLAQIPVSQWQPSPNAVPMRFREPWNENYCLTLWTVPPEWEAGRLRLPFYWEVHCPVGGYWSVFVHLSNPQLQTCQVGDNRHVLAQYDSMPDGGNLPLPAFQPGYVVQDAIVLPFTVPQDDVEELRLQVGLYDAGGTFIRAFVQALKEDSSVTVGECSPELVNIPLPPTPIPPSDSH